jgi:ABC-type phosphate/phosphonate transport system substrate-binding protein
VIAALPMYDRPELAGAHDRLWAAIRARLGHGPPRLERTADLRALWQHPDLLLAQACGLPLRGVLRGRVAYVGTPDYGVEGAPAGYYRSIWVARRGAGPSRPAGGGGAHPPGFGTAWDGARLACNDALSQSGWAAACASAGAAGIRFGAVILTGAHRASAEAVAEGRADLACLDAVSWRLLERHEPALAARLAPIGATEPTPGLPLITARRCDPAPIFEAVSAAIGALAPEDRRALRLRGLVRIPLEAYEALPLPPPAPQA